MLSTLVSRRSITFAGLLALVGCGDANGPQPISVEQVSGAYVTEIPASGTAFGSLMLTTTENGVVVDQVARGTKIELVLAANGTTTGSLFVPDIDTEDGKLVPLFGDLAGTWRLEGNQVLLSHEEDTFLRDIPLTVNGDRLEGDRTFNGARVRISMVRR